MPEKVAILENIRSCHNVGSIFRTADGAGFRRIFCAGYTPTPPDRRIEKVSLGAENFIEWERVADSVACAKKLRANGFSIFALEQTDRSEPIFDADFPEKKIAIVLGNEVDGVSDEILKMADRRLEIPMFGQKNSLNVSVAAGIAFFAINHSSDFSKKKLVAKNAIAGTENQN